MFRDLQCLLIEEGGLDGLISAPFPVTLRRSSIGVRMNAEAVEMRRQALNAVKCCLQFYLMLRCHIFIFAVVD